MITPYFRSLLLYSFLFFFILFSSLLFSSQSGSVLLLVLCVCCRTNPPSALPRLPRRTSLSQNHDHIDFVKNNSGMLFSHVIICNFLFKSYFLQLCLLMGSFIRVKENICLYFFTSYFFLHSLSQNHDR